MFGLGIWSTNDTVVSELSECLRAVGGSVFRLVEQFVWLVFCLGSDSFFLLHSLGSSLFCSFLVWGAIHFSLHSLGSDLFLLVFIRSTAWEQLLPKQGNKNWCMAHIDM